MDSRNAQSGFTLIEIIVAMVVGGIVLAMVGMFIRAPIQSYLDMSQRAEFTDAADTALRRIARDVRLALPNSVRVSGAAVEFLPTSTGGRYRSAAGGAGTDPLEFDGVDVSGAFDVLGEPITLAAGDQIVVYNLGIPGADAYEGNTLATHVRRAVSGAGTYTTIPFTPSLSFPFASPSFRFHVVNTPVTYICDAATRTLRRYWGYAIQLSQASVDSIDELNALTSPPTTTRGSAILAGNVSNCQFSYAPGITERNGLLTMLLQLSANDESVQLIHQVHVNNAP